MVVTLIINIIIMLVAAATASYCWYIRQNYSVDKTRYVLVMVSAIIAFCVALGFALGNIQFIIKYNELKTEIEQLLEGQNE